MINMFASWLIAIFTSNVRCDQVALFAGERVDLDAGAAAPLGGAQLFGPLQSNALPPRRSQLEQPRGTVASRTIAMPLCTLGCALSVHACADVHRPRAACTVSALPFAHPHRAELLPAMLPLKWQPDATRHDACDPPVGRMHFATLARARQVHAGWLGALSATGTTCFMHFLAAVAALSPPAALAAPPSPHASFGSHAARQVAAVR